MRDRQGVAQHAERGSGDVGVGTGPEPRREADGRRRGQVVSLDQALRRWSGQGQQGNAEPGARGDTSGNVTKLGRLETGLEIKVPLYIQEGEKVKVYTETREFAGRA